MPNTKTLCLKEKMMVFEFPYTNTQAQKRENATLSKLAGSP
jgi:hypothetical protein